MTDVYTTRTVTLDGTLGVWTYARWRPGNSVASMLLDIAHPLPPDVSGALLIGPPDDNGNHDKVYGIRGKAAKTLRPEDNGRPVRITGRLRTRGGRPYGELTRVSIIFTDDPAAGLK